MPSSPAPASLIAGGAMRKLTPRMPMFLYGYPHVPRISTGVHDDLFCSAFYLSDGNGATLFLANDLIFVGRALVERVRAGISRQAGLPPHAIAVTATHTHSGPVTVNYLSNRADRVVPPADPAYLEWAAAQMIEAGLAAIRSAVPAQAGLNTVRTAGIGTNRHDVNGPADPEVPVLVARDREGQVLACACVHAMHTTVLHEDSTLVSADFPHFCREHLWAAGLVPRTSPILFLSGAAGDQSPRHVTQANTFTEARRLGERLGHFVATAFQGISYQDHLAVTCEARPLALEARVLPSVEDAVAAAHYAHSRFERLRAEGIARTELRSAECDVFGADETVELARAAADGSLERAVQDSSPAEIQLVRLGPWNFVFWPGEFFVDYALELKLRSPQTFLVTLANGELQGYIVTPEAALRGVYEAGNAVFSPANGRRFIEATMRLIRSKS